LKLIPGAVIVVFPEADLVLSAVDVAVIVTELPAGTALGAVYVVAAALAVCVGLNVPQALAGAQDQSTPPPVDASLATVAAIWAVAPTCSEAGGAVLKETEITGGVVPPPFELEPPPQPTHIETATAHRSSPIQFFIISNAFLGGKPAI
jgi:hypothetical protein